MRNLQSRPIGQTFLQTFLYDSAPPFTNTSIHFNRAASDASPRIFLLLMGGFGIPSGKGSHSARLHRLATLAKLLNPASRIYFLHVSEIITSLNWPLYHMCRTCGQSDFKSEMLNVSSYFSTTFEEKMYIFV